MLDSRGGNNQIQQQQTTQEQVQSVDDTDYEDLPF